MRWERKAWLNERTVMNNNRETRPRVRANGEGCARESFAWLRAFRAPIELCRFINFPIIGECGRVSLLICSVSIGPRIINHYCCLWQGVLVCDTCVWSIIWWRIRISINIAKLFRYTKPAGRFTTKQDTGTTASHRNNLDTSRGLLYPTSSGYIVCGCVTRAIVLNSCQYN